MRGSFLVLCESGMGCDRQSVKKDSLLVQKTNMRFVHDESMDELLDPLYDIDERRMQRLEQRYRRAQFILIGARARLIAVRESPFATELQIVLALQLLQLAQRRLDDIIGELEALEERDSAA
jgi:hypothetical protein